MTLDLILRPTVDEPAKREAAIRARYWGRPEEMQEVLASTKAWEDLRAMAIRETR